MYKEEDKDFKEFEKEINEKFIIPMQAKVYRI
jgi:hypothetical protein